MSRAPASLPPRLAPGSGQPLPQWIRDTFTGARRPARATHASRAVIRPGASVPGAQVPYTALKVKSVSRTGVARVAPFDSTMAIACPEVSDRLPAVV